jgi:hypothetical protein
MRATFFSALLFSLLLATFTASADVTVEGLEFRGNAEYSEGYGCFGGKTPDGAIPQKEVFLEGGVVRVYQFTFQNGEVTALCATSAVFFRENYKTESALVHLWSDFHMEVVHKDGREIVVTYSGSGDKLYATVYNGDMQVVSLITIPWSAEGSLSVRVVTDETGKPAGLLAFVQNPWKPENGYAGVWLFKDRGSYMVWDVAFELPKEILYPTDQSSAGGNMVLRGDLSSAYTDFFLNPRLVRAKGCPEVGCLVFTHTFGVGIRMDTIWRGEVGHFIYGLPRTQIAFFNPKTNEVWLPAGRKVQFYFGMDAGKVLFWSPTVLRNGQVRWDEYATPIFSDTLAKKAGRSFDAGKAHVFPFGQGTNGSMLYPLYRNGALVEVGHALIQER